MLELQRPQWCSSCIWQCPIQSNWTIRSPRESAVRYLSTTKWYYFWWWRVPDRNAWKITIKFIWVVKVLSIWHLLPGDRLPWPQHRPVMGTQWLIYCIRPSLRRHFQCFRKPIEYCCGPIQRWLLPRLLCRSDTAPPGLWPYWLHRRM